MKNKTVEKCFAVLESVTAHEGAVTLKELSARLNMPPGTLSRLVSDLVEAGYLAKSGYHRWEPALGVVRLGQNAMSHFPPAAQINPMLRQRAAELGVEAALGGIDRGQLVYLYRSNAYAESDRAHLPCRVPLYRSNIAIMVLAKSFEVEKALAILRASRPEGESDPDDDTLRGLLSSAAKEGYLVRREGGGRWNICFPVEFDGAVFGLSLFGDGAENEAKLDRMLFETSLLCGRIHSQLRQISA